MIYVVPWQWLFGGSGNSGGNVPSDDNNSAEHGYNNGFVYGDGFVGPFPDGSNSGYNNSGYNTSDYGYFAQMQNGGDFVYPGLDNLPQGGSPVMNPGDRPLENQDTSGSGIDTSYGFVDFIKGLVASQGAENTLNRDFNAAEAEANRVFQAREAQLQRDWYERMSNSAYTRAVEDMKNAGINPILAYTQGGASSATSGIGAGSAASYNVTGGDTLSSLANGLANLISAVSSAKNGADKNALSLLSMFL